MRLLNFFKSIWRAFLELLFGIPKSKTGNPLRDLLIDLSNNESLRDMFLKDPVKVMNKYGLSEEQQQWVLNGDTDAISQDIGEESSASTYIEIPKH